MLYKSHEKSLKAFLSMLFCSHRLSPSSLAFFDRNSFAARAARLALDFSSLTAIQLITRLTRGKDEFKQDNVRTKLRPLPSLPVYANVHTAVNLSSKATDLLVRVRYQNKLPPVRSHAPSVRTRELAVLTRGLTFRAASFPSSLAARSNNTSTLCDLRVPQPAQLGTRATDDHRWRAGHAP